MIGCMTFLISDLVGPNKVLGSVTNGMVMVVNNTHTSLAQQPYKVDRVPNSSVMHAS